jgi:hypothetical protein
MFTIRLSLRCLTITSLIVASLATPVFAQATLAPPLPVATPDAQEPAPLALDELGEISAEGTTTNVVTNQNLNATNSGNTINADSVQNGDINFSGNALTGFNGVGNFVNNTGNNNNLQGSISVTVTGAPLSQ